MKAASACPDCGSIVNTYKVIRVDRKKGTPLTILSYVIFPGFLMLAGLFMIINFILFLRQGMNTTLIIYLGMGFLIIGAGAARIAYWYFAKKHQRFTCPDCARQWLVEPELTSGSTQVLSPNPKPATTSSTAACPQCGSDDLSKKVYEVDLKTNEKTQAADHRRKQTLLRNGFFAAGVLLYLGFRLLLDYGGPAFSQYRWIMLAATFGLIAAGSVMNTRINSTKRNLLFKYTCNQCGKVWEEGNEK